MSTNAADTGNSKDKKGLAAVPVALTVLATIFAGMSSTEMTRSMFYRSLAAQHQAKAGDQWGLFQAKKIRGTTFETANDMAMLFYVKPFDESIAVGLREALKQSESDPAAAKIPALPAAAKNLRTALESEDLKSALRFLGNAELPTVETKPVETETLGELLQAIRSRVPETKTESLVVKVPPGAVEAAIETATSNADAFDHACEPVVKSVRTLEKAIGDVDRLVSGVVDPSNELKALSGAVHGAALSLRFAVQDLTARRYDREAKFNQQIGELYEIQVRMAGQESERHRLRSKNFFYAMLFAQAGVTIAALALAKSRQSAFWFIAGLAGLAAVAIGAYVYLAM
jgi:hypothetical protein